MCHHLFRADSGLAIVTRRAAECSLRAAGMVISRGITSAGLVIQVWNVWRQCVENMLVVHQPPHRSGDSSFGNL